MSQRKMLQFSTGALLLLLPWIGGLVLGEIGDDFSKCLDFFYNKTPPKGINAAGYQPICQCYKNQYRFASLYHRQHRTPLYSAYILKPADGLRPSNSWKYEPQLVYPSNNPEMQNFPKITDQNVKDSKAVDEDYKNQDIDTSLVSHNASPDMQPFPVPGPIYRNVTKSQAVNEDYKNQDFTRGHLAPSSHQNTTEDREATFTLTNIVPQKEVSNSGPWQQLENDMLQKSNECKEPMYVMTGVMPYESGPIKMNNRVLVPEYLWSAYCCKSKSGNFLTSAAVGRNDNKSDNTIVPKAKGYDVKMMTLLELEGILKKRLKMPELSLFKGHCG